MSKNNQEKKKMIRDVVNVVASEAFAKWRSSFGGVFLNRLTGKLLASRRRSAERRRVNRGRWLRPVTV